MPETEQTKTPHSRRGFGIGCSEKAYRAHHPEVPGRGLFFEQIAARVFMTMSG